MTITNSNNENKIKNSEENSCSRPKRIPTSKIVGLTNFAYHETSLKRSITAVGDPNRNYSKSNNTGNNISTNKNVTTKINRGLIRVKLDLSKIPIYRTYVQGIRCDDPYCTYRHDAPNKKESPYVPSSKNTANV